MPIQSLRARRHEVANLLQHAEGLGLSRAAKQRLAWFAYALAHQGNVSLACRYFGISRSTFLRWAQRFDPRRPETLEELSRRPHTVRTPQVSASVVTLIREYRLSSVTLGKQQIAQKLHTDHGITLSASTVGRVIARERLFFADIPSHAHKRIGLDFSTAGSSVADRLRTVLPSSDDGEEESGASSIVPLPISGS